MSDRTDLPKDVPYIVHEDAQVRNERHIKRLLILIGILIILLAGTNMAWLYMWNQYDTISYDQDGEGINNINTDITGSMLNVTKDKDKDKEKAKYGKGSQDSKE